jgi:propionyl-CoA carboxylase alpha chain
MLSEALDVYVVRGVTHNVCLLRDILNHPRFHKGDISTSFIPQVG